MTKSQFRVQTQTSIILRSCTFTDLKLIFLLFLSYSLINNINTFNSISLTTSSYIVTTKKLQINFKILRMVQIYKHNYNTSEYETTNSLTTSIITLSPLSIYIVARNTKEKISSDKLVDVVASRYSRASIKNNIPYKGRSISIMNVLLIINNSIFDE